MLCIQKFRCGSVRLAFPVLCLVLLVQAGCKGNVEEFKEYHSPDRKHVATFLLINFGGTVDYSPEVEIRKATETRGSRGNVFRGSKTHRLKVEWVSNNHLRIYCSTLCQVERLDEKWNDIKVELIRSDDWAAGEDQKPPDSTK